MINYLQGKNTDKHIENGHVDVGQMEGEWDKLGL